MSTLLNILIIVVSSVALIKGVNIFIDTASNLAGHFKISGYTISFFLIAIGTSLPELVVSITSAVEQNPLLAFGNAMGSNIALVTLVIALPAILSKGVTTRTILNSRDIYFAVLFSILPILLIIDGTLTRIDGTVLLVGYLIYSRAVLKRTSSLKNIGKITHGDKILKQLGLFIVALLILLGSSSLIVQSAISLSNQLAIGIGFIGLTITALGTSIPELAFTIAAVRKQKEESILGDIIGSVVANSTLVLGIAAVIFPISIKNTSIGVPTLFFLVFAMLVFLRFARTKEKFDSFEGILLLGLYSFFVAVEYFAAQGKLGF